MSALNVVSTLAFSCLTLQPISNQGPMLIQGPVSAGLLREILYIHLLFMLRFIYKIYDQFIDYSTEVQMIAECFFLFNLSLLYITFCKKGNIQILFGCCF